MGKQRELALRWDLRELCDRRGEELLGVVRALVKSEFKQADELATDLGVAPSHFSASLHDANRHFSLKWLPRLLLADRDLTVLRFLAALQGCDVSRKRPRTPEQELADLKRVCRDSGAAGEALLRAAEIEEGT